MLVDRPERTWRAIIAVAVVAIASLVAPAPAAIANPYGSPGSLSDVHSSGGGLGQSVSISTDGRVAVVGEPNYNGGAGSALVYSNSEGAWSFVTRLEPTGEIGAGHFGAAVSMDGGGETLVVGAPDDNGGVGSAWVFALSDGTWTKQARLVDTGEFDHARFGASVAVASSGQLVLVGEPMADLAKGNVVTYEYFNGFGWEQWQHMHRDGVPVGAHYGASVALPAGAGAALIGAPNAAGGDGAVYPCSFYGLGGPFWTERSAIPSPAQKGHFGASVAISLGGEHGFVGAPLANGGDGEVYQYKRSGDSEGVFTNPSGLSGGQFGASVAVAGQTLNELLIGAPGENSGAGAVYAFDAAHDGVWSNNGAAVSPATALAAGDSYGASVAVAADGSHALVGAPGVGFADGCGHALHLRQHHGPGSTDGRSGLRRRRERDRLLEPALHNRRLADHRLHGDLVAGRVWLSGDAREVELHRLRAHRRPAVHVRRDGDQRRRNQPVVGPVRAGHAAGATRRRGWRAG